METGRCAKLNFISPGQHALSHPAPRWRLADGATVERVRVEAVQRFPEPIERPLLGDMELEIGKCHGDHRTAAQILVTAAREGVLQNAEAEFDLAAVRTS